MFYRALEHQKAIELLNAAAVHQARAHNAAASANAYGALEGPGLDAFQGVDPALLAEAHISPTPSEQSTVPSPEKDLLEKEEESKGKKGKKGKMSRSSVTAPGRQVKHHYIQHLHNKNEVTGFIF